MLLWHERANDAQQFHKEVLCVGVHTNTVREGERKSVRENGGEILPLLLSAREHYVLIPCPLTQIMANEREISVSFCFCESRKANLSPTFERKRVRDGGLGQYRACVFTDG